MQINRKTDRSFTFKYYFHFKIIQCTKYDCEQRLGLHVKMNIKVHHRLHFQDIDIYMYICISEAFITKPPLYLQKPAKSWHFITLLLRVMKGTSPFFGSTMKLK